MCLLLIEVITKGDFDSSVVTLALQPFLWWLEQVQYVPFFLLFRQEYVYPLYSNLPMLLFLPREGIISATVKTKIHNICIELKNK